MLLVSHRLVIRVRLSNIHGRHDFCATHGYYSLPLFNNYCMSPTKSSFVLSCRPGQFSLYIDGISQGPSMSVPGLNFELSTSPTAGPGVLYLGGVDQGFVAEIDDLPPFTGCMSDFAYNFG